MATEMTITCWFGQEDLDVEEILAAIASAVDCEIVSWDIAEEV